jgi:hypothetical protein
MDEIKYELEASYDFFVLPPQNEIPAKLIESNMGGAAAK